MQILEISYVTVAPENVHLRAMAVSPSLFMSIDLSCRAVAGCGKNECSRCADASGHDYSQRRVFIDSLTTCSFRADSAMASQTCCVAREISGQWGSRRPVRITSQNVSTIRTS